MPNYSLAIIKSSFGFVIRFAAPIVALNTNMHLRVAGIHIMNSYVLVHEVDQSGKLNLAETILLLDQCIFVLVQFINGVDNGGSTAQAFRRTTEGLWQATLLVTDDQHMLKELRKNIKELRKKKVEEYESDGRLKGAKDHLPKLLGDFCKLEQAFKDRSRVPAEPNDSAALDQVTESFPDGPTTAADQAASGSQPIGDLPGHPLRRTFSQTSQSRTSNETRAPNSLFDGLSIQSHSTLVQSNRSIPPGKLSATESRSHQETSTTARTEPGVADYEERDNVPRASTSSGHGFIPSQHLTYLHLSLDEFEPHTPTSVRSEGSNLSYQSAPPDYVESENPYASGTEVIRAEMPSISQNLLAPPQTLSPLPIHPSAQIRREESQTSNMASTITPNSLVADAAPLHPDPEPADRRSRGFKSIFTIPSRQRSRSSNGGT